MCILQCFSAAGSNSLVRLHFLWTYFFCLYCRESPKLTLNKAKHNQELNNVTSLYLSFSLYSHFDGFSFNLKVIKVLTLCSYQHKMLITFKRRPKFIFDFNNSWLLCVDGVWNLLEIRIIIEGSCQIIFFWFDLDISLEISGYLFYVAFISTPYILNI